MRTTRARFGMVVRAVAALTLALGLAGCGALIDTTLIVNADGSGERVMVLTLGADDMDELQGDMSAVDASIRARLPQSIDYSGVSQTRDGGLSATFTLPFESPTDYVEKATALLALGNSSSSPPAFAVSDSLLVRGVEIEEGFSSHALLRWMFAGLVEDGLVSSSTDEGNMYDLGTTVLEFAGQQRVQRFGQFNDGLLDDHGFAEVTVQTNISDLENIERILTFRAVPDADDGLYSDYLSDHTPADAELQRDGDAWTMTFEGDATEVAERTDMALSTTGSALELEARPSPGDPAVMTLTVGSVTDCASVCAADAPALTDTIMMPEGYSPSQLELPTSGEPGEVRFVPAFEEVSQELRFGLFGNVTVKSTFAVASSSLEVLGDGFERLLSPADGIGTLEVAREDERTVYTVIIDAPADEFGARYAAWAPGSYFGRTSVGDEAFLWSTTQYTFDSGLAGVVGLHPVSDTPERTVSLPFGSWMTAGDATAAADQPVIFQVRAVNVVGSVSAVGVLAAAVVGLLLAIHRRDALRERLANWRGSTPHPLVAIGETRRRVRPSLTALLSAPAEVAHMGSLLDMPRMDARRTAAGSLLVRTGRPVPTPRCALVGATFGRAAGAGRPPLIRPTENAPRE